MEGKLTNFSSNCHIFHFKLEILRQNLPDILSGDDKFSTEPAQNFVLRIRRLNTGSEFYSFVCIVKFDRRDTLFLMETAALGKLTRMM